MKTRTLTTGRWRQVARVAIPVGVSAMILAGCVSASDSDDTGSATTEGTTTLTVWGSRGYYLTDEQVAIFEAAHPGITIEAEIVDTDDILERMIRAKDAGQPLPDIIQDDVYLIEAYAQAGMVRSLNDLVAEFEADEPEVFAESLPIVWEEPTRDGEILGAAVTANFDILYYNPSFFEEAGVELPLDTYEELYEAAKALKATRPDQVPWSIQALAGEGVTGLKTVLVGTGAPFAGATPDLTSPGGQYTIEFFQRLQAEELLPVEAIAWGEAESRGAYVAGAGMIIDGFSAGGDFLDIGDFEYGTDWAGTLMPIETGVAGTVTGARSTSARMWSISTGVEDERLDAAFEFIKFLASPAYQIPQVLAGGVPPRNSVALNAPEVSEFYPFLTDELRQGYLDSVGVPSALNAGDVELVLEQLWGEIITGVDATPAELAAKYQPLLDALG